MAINLFYATGLILHLFYATGLFLKQKDWVIEMKIITRGVAVVPSAN